MLDKLLREQRQTQRSDGGARRSQCLKFADLFFPVIYLFGRTLVTGGRRSIGARMASDPRAVSDGTSPPASSTDKGPAQSGALDLLIGAVLANRYHLSASEVIQVMRFGMRSTSVCARKAQHKRGA
jgi:hypothetical protein